MALEQTRQKHTTDLNNKLDANIEVVEKYIPESGVVLNQQQREKERNSASSSNIVTDASNTTVNNVSNTTVVSDPHARGQGAPGESGSKVG